MVSPLLLRRLRERLARVLAIEASHTRERTQAINSLRAKAPSSTSLPGFPI
jgi:hypothetical protein